MRGAKDESSRLHFSDGLRALFEFKERDAVYDELITLMFHDGLHASDLIALLRRNQRYGS
jgi:hypothetical protein